MLFILGCIGVVFVAAIVVLVTIAWLAGENAMFGNYTWFEWIAFGGELSTLSMRVYLAIVGVLCFAGYWIGHSTGMW